MKNTMAMAKRMMNDVRASGAKLDTMDDLYAVVSNYADVTKSQFVDAYNQVKAEMGNELSDCELDMVVGGGVGDFLQDHWKEILVCSAIVLFCTAAGAGFGALMAIGASSTGTVSATSLAAGCIAGGLVGAGIGGAAAAVTVSDGDN